MKKHLLRSKMLAFIGLVFYGSYSLATTCPNAINIPAAPVTAQAIVCGAGNDLSATTVPAACGGASNSYKGGTEALYTFTPAVTGVHTISYSGVTWTSIFVYQGCPTSGGTCVGSIGNSSGTKQLTPTLTAGLQYFIWFDTWPTPTSPCPGTFSLTGPPVPCAGVPAPGNTTGPANACAGVPFNLGLQNPTGGTGVSYQWRVSTVSNTGPWTPVGTNSATYAATQSVQSWYRCDVTCSAGPSTTSSNVIQVNQNPPNQCYCTPVYTVGKTDGDLISQVQVTGTTLNNNSGTSPTNPAYTFFNTLPAHTGNLQAGTTYNVQVTYGSFTAQQCAVWIDFNEDGVFSTPSERVGFTTSNSTAGFQTVSFPISLPCNPVPGVKRMRVRNVYFTNGNTIDPCASYSYGETEDYNVTVLAPPPCPMISGLSAGTPGSFSVPLNWTIGCAETAWNVEYGPVGFTPGTGTTVPAGTNVNFSLTGLNSTTAYHAYVSAACGPGNNSNPFGPVAFTTDIAPCSGTPTQSTTVSTVGAACLAQNFTLSMNQTYTDLQIAYQWQFSINNVDWTDIAGATSATRVQTQSEATWYRCIVTCNASSQSMTSTAIQVTMGLPTQCYCEATYTVGKTDGDLISQVQVTGTTLNNNSGTSPTNPAFTFFNTLPEHTGNLQAGTTYNVNVTYGSFTAQQCAVWIDFNENGVFETPSERVGFTTSNSTAGFQTVSFPISLPCNPIPGVKRMRVRNVYFTNGNTIDPCASYSFGETEDYNVTVLAPPPCPSVTGLTAGTPGAFNVNLNWNQGCAESAWNVEYGPVGFTPGTGTIVPAGTNVNFDLTGLNSSTAYHAYVSADCGIDGTSAAFGPVSFTTTVAPCAGTPTQSNALSSSPNACIGANFTLSMNQTYNDLQISYQWQSSLNGTDWLDISGATNATRDQNQTVATFYRCVVTCGVSTLSMNSNSVQVTMGNPTDCYCQAQYSSGKTAGDLISNVAIPGTTLANNSGTAQVNPAYTYFTGPTNTAELVQGGSYNVTVSVGTWGDQHLRAWIDYNDNGIFEDAETIGSTVVAPGAGFTGPFPPAVFNVNLSGSAPLGTHRMRIRGVWQSVPSTVFAAAIDPCISYGFGETEDYAITIVAPITSQLIAGHCNLTNVAMSQNLRAVDVLAPSYRFRVQGPNNGGTGWNGNTYIYDAPTGSRNMRFQFIPGAVWGATYAITVAVGDGFGNFGPYGSSCNATLENQTLTQVNASTCGTSVSASQFVSADWAPGASAYRFRISGANNGGTGWVTNSYEHVTTAPVRKFTFGTNVPGAVFGATYSIDVAVQSADGSWLPYGSPCNVTLVAPTTQIQTSQCNITDVLPNTSVSANQVAGASGYRFKFVGANSTNWVNNEFILDRPNRTFWFNLVTGSLQGEEYEVSVAVMDANGNYGAYGTMCTVTRFGVPELPINENDMFVNNKTLDAINFVATASHNPFTTDFGIQVLNANDSETINVVIYDMSGKLIERQAVNPMDIENAKFGANLASGMYMIEVKQGTNQAVIRQVKN